MNATSPLTLEEAIRQSGEGWLIDWFDPPDKAMEHIRQTLAEVSRRAKERLGDKAPDFSEEAIVREFHRNPQKVRGFFQALGGTRTPDMLLMVWRIIQGMEVKDVHLSYHRQKDFEVRVTLESPHSEDEKYVSTRISDFALFRHIGIHEISNRPVFDGFYALKLQPFNSGR